MSPEFRDRVFLPLVVPVGLFAALIAVAFAVSRILLAVPEFGSVVLAIVLAGYVLLVAAVVAVRPRIAPRSLGVGMALGLVGVLAAGAIAGAAGPRQAEEEGGESAGLGGAEGTAAGEAGAPAGGAPAGSIEFIAIDIAWQAPPATVPPGPATIALVNQGNSIHNLAFEGEQPDPVVEADAQETATGEFEFEPGQYTFYCSIPGHRAAGMEGQLTVQ